MAKKAKKHSVTVALRAVVEVPVNVSSLEEAQALTIELSDVATFPGSNNVHDFRVEMIGVSVDTGWDFLDS